jgi:hypothetical protein
MRSDVFFIRPVNESVPKDAPYELLKSLSDTLKEAGYSFGVSDEGAYIFDKVRQAIFDTGITRYTNSVLVKESVLPDMTTREELLDLMRYMLRNIRQTKNSYSSTPTFSRITRTRITFPTF